MENVPDVIGANNVKHFAQWVKKLEQLGYTSKWQCLNAKDYGVPQNRDRCFMVSWLGNHYYDFPTPIKLEKRLKDVLETNVDEKYYLDDDTIERISKWKSQQQPLKNILNGNSCSPCLTARGAGEEHSGMVLYGEPTCDGGNLETKVVVVDGFNQSIRADQTCFGTITRNAGADLKRNGQGIIEIVDEPLALDEQNGYIRQDGTVGTLTTDGSSPKHNNRIVEPNGKHPYELSDAMKKYIVSKDDKYQVSNGNLIVNRDIACSKTTREGCTRADASDYISPDLMPNENIANKNTLNYRIRKLTPKECGRLMGVRDDDIDTMSVNQSNSSLFHCFGDSIVVDVLMAIFKQML